MPRIWRFAPRRSRALATAIAMMLVVLVCLGGVALCTHSQRAGESSGTAAIDGRLVARFVDVGQGDGNVVEFPDGKTLLIDTGDEGADAVAATLREDGVERVDWLVATHPDSDHIGGLADVMEDVEVSTVWAPRAESTTRTYTRFLKAVREEGLAIKTACAGETIAEGDGYSVSVVWPPKGAGYESTNDMSAVVTVSYGSTRFLYTGDAPAAALKRAGVGHVDVLKVSHHGSASGTTKSLARSLGPRVAVISYGLGNSYGHPTRTVLGALESAGAHVYGTGAEGTVTVTSDGSDVSVSTERQGEVEPASESAGASSSGLGSSR